MSYMYGSQFCLYLCGTLISSGYEFSQIPALDGACYDGIKNDLGDIKWLITLMHIQDLSLID